MFLLLAILTPMLAGGFLPLWKIQKKSLRALYVFLTLAVTAVFAALGAAGGRFTFLSFGNGLRSGYGFVSGLRLLLLRRRAGLLPPLPEAEQTLAFPPGLDRGLDLHPALYRP